jgi:hypothetical protein
MVEGRARLRVREDGVSRARFGCHSAEEGLRLLSRVKRQAEVWTLFGQVRWESDLDGSRLSRTPSE